MMTKEKWIKVLVSVVIAVAFYLIPYEAMGVALNSVEKRVISIFVIAALFWILEPFPIWTTSMFVIVTMLLTVSNRGLIFMQTDAAGVPYANLVSYKSIMATFADPIIMLFLGGFFLAAAATKYRLDMNLAKVLLKPFGKQQIGRASCRERV